MICQSGPAHQKQFHRSYESFTPSFASIVSAIGLTACTSPDAGVSALQQKVLTSPSPKAITGLWHRRTTRPFGRVDHYTLLLRPDGSGMIKLKATGGTQYEGSLMIGADGQMFDSSQPRNVSWRYVGDGKWMIRGVNPGESREHVYQTTGDMLVVEGKCAFQRQ
jgi:hypothetical protein